MALSRPGEQSSATAILVSLFLSIALLPLDALAWWNDDWSFRKRIDIDIADADIDTALADVPVLVRLHSGNFAYFLDAQTDGSDLRFVAADDLTPLEFEIERYDGVVAVGAIWVKLPRLDPGKPQDHFWMYYGNDAAVANDASAATWNVNQTGVYHFNEPSGLPRDSTAFGHNVEKSSAGAGGSGLIDMGLRFDAEQSLTIAGSPAIAVDKNRGNTISFWLRPDGSAEDAAILTHNSAGGRLRIGMRGLVPYVELVAGTGDDEANAALISAAGTLTTNRWHHIAVTVDTASVTLRLDGAVAAVAEFDLPAIAGDIVVGAADELPGFRGAIDELRFANIARPEAWLKAQLVSQSLDSLMTLPGEDESRDDAGGGVGEYLGLLWALLDAVRAEGWAIIILLLSMGLLSADVLIGKSVLLSRIEKADDDFLDAFDANRAAANDNPQGRQQSPLASLYAVSQSEWHGLAEQAGKTVTELPPQALEVVRTALEGEIVEQSNRLNARLVLMTIAVSGGPFLGLLGTVVGVMITFASIAAAGDVNVNTIAPGVAAALVTTVMGLLVAIPSLFGYNYLATRIARRTAAMEVFSDRLMSRLTVSSVIGGSADEVSRAA